MKNCNKREEELSSWESNVKMKVEDSSNLSLPHMPEN